MEKNMMQKEKNLKLLRYRFPPGVTLDSMANSTSQFKGVGNYENAPTQYLARNSDLLTVVQTLSVFHLGFDLAISVDNYLIQGFDVAVDYFCTDWWQNDERDRLLMDKKNHKKNRLDWVDPFSWGLLLGFLCERWDDLERVCDWVEADIKSGEKGEDFEEELVDLYRCLAAGLRTKPMPGLEQVEARILKSRKKRPKLLFQAWDAARSGNQASFHDAFLKAIQHHESGFDPTSREFRAPIQRIAPHHSVVALAARRKGMTLPELTPRQNAFLISRESLGLDSK
jgi:hypothetical protein